MQVKNNRNVFIDFIKGVAIIAVALYHFGGEILPYGYLGVDIFLVVGGYFLIRSLKKGLEEESFRYWSFILHKLERLWPLVLLAIIISLALGFVLMLPDDYENLSESAIASTFFLNNILQCITTKNYWNIANMYKPLMHLWYVGVLFQSYVVLPPIIVVFVKVFKKAEKGIFIGTATITIISFAIFMMPCFSTAWKFYYLPFRLYEITSGGLIFLINEKTTHKTAGRSKEIGLLISLACLIVLLCMRSAVVSASVMLVLTVLMTSLLIWLSDNLDVQNVFINNVLIAVAKIGQRSYSIYIWHQVIIAFLFYSVFQHHGIKCFTTFILLTVIIALTSYRFIECGLDGIIKKARKNEFIGLGICILGGVAVSIVSLVIYNNAGVVRNVPELGIYKNNVHKNMHSSYCDRPYSWNKDFEDDGRIHILVIGNSFGRDWANILYEWDNALDISYGYYQKENINKYIDRIALADIVFYAMGPDYDDIPKEVLDLIDPEKLYIIGNKNFGESNGIIYARRKSEDYFKQTAVIPESLRKQNEICISDYGQHYIDMLSVVKVNDLEVRVFTDNNMFISQDCKHLTQAGAEYYANKLDIKSIIRR